MFKVAIVSRDIPVLRVCTTVRLDPDNDQEIDSDISTFLRARVKELSWIGVFEDIQDSVHDALIKRAEGTFLWVGFAMHELLQIRTCTKIQKTLESLPSGLPAIYERMLLRISPDQRDFTRTLLQWVAVAARPLRLLEVAVAISMSDSLPRIKPGRAIRDQIILCGPLLRTEEHGEDPPHVGLVHQSVRDYLLRSNCDSDAVLETFRFDRATSHLQLARRCLDCIEQDGLQRAVAGLNQNPGPGESALLEYAATH